MFESRVLKVITFWGCVMNACFSCSTRGGTPLFKRAALKKIGLLSGFGFEVPGISEPLGFLGHSALREAFPPGPHGEDLQPLSLRVADWV